MKKLSALTLLLTVSAQAQITVENCDSTLTLDKAPKTLITHDITMSEMAFSLGLEDNMIAVTGISGYNKTTPEFTRL